MSRKTNTNTTKTAKISSRKTSAPLVLTAKPTTAADDFDGEGQFEILHLMRQIKRLANNDSEVSLDAGDSLWRLADKACLIIEARNK